MNSRYKSILILLLPCVVFAVLATAVYFPTLDRAMNSIDDQQWLRDVEQRDTLVKMFDPRLQTKNSFATTYYLPAQSALYWVMKSLFGSAPKPYRVLALLIHIANALLLYFLIVSVTRERLGAALATSLFVVHVAHKQSVTWVPAAFSHPLSTFFILATLLSFFWFLKTERRIFYGVSLASFFAAFTIRETAVVTPFLLIAMELLISREEDGQPFRLRSLIKYIPFVLISVPFLGIAAYKYPRGKIHQHWGGVSLGMFPIVRFLDFLTLAVWPVKTSVVSKLTISGGLMAIAALLFYRIRQFPRLVFALLFIAATTAPYTISNFNPALAVTRYLYPALVGCSLFVAFAWAKLPDRKWIVPVASLVMFAWIAVHGVYSWQAFR